MSTSSFPFRFFFALSAAASLFYILPLSSEFGLFPHSDPLDHIHLPHSGGDSDHKGRPALLLILIFASTTFTRLLCCFLNVFSTFLLIACHCYFNMKSSNSTPSCLLLIISSFLPDILRFYFIRPSTFISASYSDLRGQSRLRNPLEEDLEPPFLTVSACRLW